MWKGWQDYHSDNKSVVEPAFFFTEKSYQGNQLLNYTQKICFLKKSPFSLLLLNTQVIVTNSSPMTWPKLSDEGNKSACSRKQCHSGPPFTPIPYLCLSWLMRASPLCRHMRGHVRHNVKCCVRLCFSNRKESAAQPRWSLVPDMSKNTSWYRIIALLFFLLWHIFNRKKKLHRI